MSSATTSSLEERFLQETVQRIAELEESRQEYDRLVDLQARLKGGSRPSARRTSNTNSNNGRSNGASGGQRKEQLLQIIGAQPGITASQVAKEMGLKAPTYIYRLRDEVVKDGTVRVDDGKMFLANAPAAA